MDTVFKGVSRAYPYITYIWSGQVVWSSLLILILASRVPGSRTQRLSFYGFL